MENHAQAHQGPHDEDEQIRADKLAASELDKRRKGRLKENPSTRQPAGAAHQTGDTEDNREDRSASPDSTDPHRRANLVDAEAENTQHPFNQEVAAEVDRHTVRPQHGDEALTTEEYGQPVGQSYGPSDENGDMETPRLPESGHQVEARTRPHRRGDTKRGPEKDQRGGVTGH